MTKLPLLRLADGRVLGVVRVLDDGVVAVQVPTAHDEHPKRLIAGDIIEVRADGKVQRFVVRTVRVRNVHLREI